MPSLSERVEEEFIRRMRGANFAPTSTRLVFQDVVAPFLGAGERLRYRMVELGYSNAQIDNWDHLVEKLEKPHGD